MVDLSVGFLAIVCLVLWLIMFGMGLIGTVICLTRYLPHYAPPAQDDSLPPVSIIRPLKGVDCSISTNLESSFKQKYHQFQIIFCVADKEDPVIPLVKSLIKKYPERDAQLIVGSSNVGANPKINNIYAAYDRVKHDIIWIVDSNVFLDDHCLLRSVAALEKEGVGFVHHLVTGVQPESFGSYLEQLFLNSAHAKMYISINYAAVASCIVGKSNMFRRSDLGSSEVLKSFGKFMSEDNIMGQYIFDKGFKHSMTQDRAFQPLGSLTVADYFKRRSRWTRIRKYVVPVATIAEVASESLMNGLCGAFAASVLFGFNPYVFFGAHMLWWFLQDMMIGYCVNPSSFKKPWLYIAAWVVREITALHLYFYAVAGSTVDWRGTLYRLNRDGTVEPALKRPTYWSTFVEFFSLTAWMAYLHTLVNPPKVVPDYRKNR